MEYCSLHFLMYAVTGVYLLPVQATCALNKKSKKSAMLNDIMPTSSCTSNRLTPSCCSSGYLTAPCAQDQHYVEHRCTGMCTGNSSSSYLSPNNHVIDHHYYKQLDVYCEITGLFNTTHLPPVRELPPLPYKVLELGHGTSSRAASGEYGVLFPTQDSDAATKPCGKQLTARRHSSWFANFIISIRSIVQNESALHK